MLLPAVVHAPPLAPPLVIHRHAAPVCLDLDTTTLTGLAVVAIGGAGLFYSKSQATSAEETSVVASPVASPPVAPASPTPSPPPLAVVKEEWPSLGGKSGPHRGAGTWPKDPPREIWWEPVGGSTGPHRGAGRWPPPEPKVVPMSPLPPSPKVSKKKPSSGGFFSVLVRKIKGQPKWPMVGGSSGPHRGAGRWPPAMDAAATSIAPNAPPAPPAPPPPPAATVRSWYDTGIRLTTTPPPPPPPGVVSWYDAGKRL
jgi:hypothetical protein